MVSSEESDCSLIGKLAEQTLKQRLYDGDSYEVQQKRLRKASSLLENKVSYEKFLQQQINNILINAYRIKKTSDAREIIFKISKFQNDSYNNCVTERKDFIAKAKRDSVAQRTQKQNQLKDRCYIYFATDLNVYNACIGRAEHLYEGNYGLMAKYIVQGRCNYVSGIDNTQLSYICKYPKTSSCSVLNDNYSDKVVDACLRCKGSRRWLAEFAASMIKRKIIPTCY